MLALTVSVSKRARVKTAPGFLSPSGRHKSTHRRCLEQHEGRLIARPSRHVLGLDAARSATAQEKHDPLMGAGLRRHVYAVSRSKHETDAGRQELVIVYSR